VKTERLMSRFWSGFKAEERSVSRKDASAGF